MASVRFLGSAFLRSALAKLAATGTLLCVVTAAATAQSQVDASTLHRKMMAGYQGWFMTSADGSGANWRHWSQAGQTPNAGTVQVDLWPDLREYAPSELTPTGFKYANGATAGLYSAYNGATVERHLKWMRDYGIDGVFVQRFVSEAMNLRAVRDQVLHNVRAGAEKHGRVFANMYDISGAKPATLVADIKADWMHLVDDQKITASPRYLRHEGRPVVSIWGFGFSDRPGSAAELQGLINWFKSGAPEKYRATVKLGVDPNWRSHASAWQAAYRSAAVISPWTVGRYRDDAGADSWRLSKITPDLNALSGSGTGYMPVVFPGFSWTNLHGGPLNAIPRRGGRFFWRQAHNAIQAGAKMVYVAMFDEVDEGTAMFKIAENQAQLPTTGKFLPLNADGEAIPSDWYLSLMGEASRMLRGERPLSATMPTVGSLPPGAEDGDGLGIDEKLGPNQSLVSGNGAYRFILQSDGNLVVYNQAGQALWAAGTLGKGGVALFMQGYGNLVLSNAAGSAVWATGTNGKGAVELVMQNDGHLVLRTASNARVWSTGSAPTAATVDEDNTPQARITAAPLAAGSDVLRVDEKLTTNQSIKSANGQYYFVLQGDGNLVLYKTGGTARWASGTVGKGGITLYMQGDGNLVLRNAAGSAVWASATNGKGGVRLVMQGDGNLVMQTAGGSAVWSTNTGDGSGGGGGSGAVVHRTVGGVNKGKPASNLSVASSARSGDYELVAVTGSSVQGGTNQPIDSALMTQQGFKLLGVRGEFDRKSEVWIRQNNGSSAQRSISITGKGWDVMWSVTTIDGTKHQLNMSNVQVAYIFGTHGTSDVTTAKISVPSGSGLGFVALMFDDSMEVTSAGNGSILFKTWGFGDGDGMASLLYQPGVAVPDAVNITQHDKTGGNQYVSVGLRIAVTPKSAVVAALSAADDVADASTDEAEPTRVKIAAAPTVSPLAAGSPVLNANEKLAVNQAIKSANGKYSFTLQSDGNLVLYKTGGAALWASGTVGKGGINLHMQGDGNLVLRNAASAAVWASGTNGKGAVRLVMQDDGNLVLLNAAGAVVWSTNTSDGSGSRARIAFVGDSGSGSNFQNVLNLIRSEGAEVTMFLGDTAYASAGDDEWDRRVRTTLAATDPVLIAVGNHDVDDSNWSRVVALAKARMGRQSAVKCDGTYGERMSCTYKNLYFVVSGVGTTGSIAGHEAFISSSLNAAPANAWRVCAWHKNQRQMQVGGKTDEVGWTAYETCRKKGAFVATGHEHSYSRTHLLSSMTNRTVASTAANFTVSPGNSFAFVSGLGGIGIRDQEIGGAWWAKVYTATQNANYGALFGDFYADRAEFYFKNIAGQVIDRFTVQKGY